MTDNQRTFARMLYDELHKELTTYAAAYFRDLAPVDDAVQELYMRACENIETLMKHENPRAWMFATLKNIMRDTYKERARNKKISEKVQQETYVQHGKTLAHRDEEDPDILYSNLVGRDDFKLFKRIADDGLSYAELAKEEGISVEACKKRVQRARKLLKKYFEKF